MPRAVLLMLLLMGCTVEATASPRSSTTTTVEASTTTTERATTTTEAPHILEAKTIGHSVGGMPIIAYRLGTPGGVPVLAATGIHGDEDGAMAVTKYLRDEAGIPEGVDLWIIMIANPDGTLDGRRTNENGVDINRNFATSDYVVAGRGTEKWSGPFAASEPETVALQNFILEVRPVLSVWWHQVNRLVSGAGNVANRALLEEYSQITGWPIRTANCDPMPCRGTATQFTNERVAGATSFVVELPDPVSREMAAQHAMTFLIVARGIVQ